MKVFYLKSKLKFSKSPQKIYSTIAELVPLIIPSPIVSITPLDYDMIERKLLISSFVLNISTKKDMRSNFLYEFANIFVKDIFKTYEIEYVIYLFENACPGMSFGNSGTDYERRTAVEREMTDYILSRLCVYRYFIEKLNESIPNNLIAFYYLISYMPFNSGYWHLQPYFGYLWNDINETGYDKNNFQEFKYLISELSKRFLNIVQIPKYTWINAHPESACFHTEGILPSLAVVKEAKYLTFHSLGGYGIIKCKRCHFSKEIVSFVHGATDATIGRQCPQCGEFCVEHNESQEYHEFGSSDKDFICPNCNYVIRERTENIFKGNQNPLFCPKCHSIDLVYETSYLS